MYLTYSTSNNPHLSLSRGCSHLGVPGIATASSYFSFYEISTLGTQSLKRATEVKRNRECDTGSLIALIVRKSYLKTSQGKCSKLNILNHIRQMKSLLKVKVPLLATICIIICISYP